MNNSGPVFVLLPSAFSSCANVICPFIFVQFYLCSDASFLRSHLASDFFRKHREEKKKTTASGDLYPHYRLIELIEQKKILCGFLFEMNQKKFSFNYLIMCAHVLCSSRSAAVISMKTRQKNNCVSCVWLIFNR